MVQGIGAWILMLNKLKRSYVFFNKLKSHITSETNYYKGEPSPLNIGGWGDFLCITCAIFHVKNV